MISKFWLRFAGLLACILPVSGHPLGNFTVNHFARLDLSPGSVRIKYVVDLAEIPAFSELRGADRNGNGTLEPMERDAYLQHASNLYISGLDVESDSTRVPLTFISGTLTTPPGAGGLKTLRLEFIFSGDLPATAHAVHRVRMADRNDADRIGWREMVANPKDGVSVFDSSAFANSVTDELRLYPADMLAAPLAESDVALSWIRGAAPADSAPLRTRNGQPVVAARDRFAELIAVEHLTPFVVFLGLLIAAMLGAAHALSPGHGKTVVGAYLVGSRGTPRHAAFLGLTVTITHTAGVFLLGLVTLFASRYVVPERLFPIISFVSGAIVALIGLRLFLHRAGKALGIVIDHHHNHSHGHVHSHGGRPHSHLPPPEIGSGTITWRSLLALGVSGGLLPCPSALVVLLSAIALHRVGYGLLLVIAFSFGLAATLTGVGLAFVYAGRFLARFGTVAHSSWLMKLFPALSAFVVMSLGLAICYEAVAQSGFKLMAYYSAFAERWHAFANAPLSSLSALAILGLGLVLGLKHAMEADHVVAVSTMVSEHRKLSRVVLIGGLWGAGHTATLVVVGVFVLMLGVAIPERVAGVLEFVVALMIIGLSGRALSRALRGRTDTHIHTHSHDGLDHSHVHFHDGNALHGHPVADHTHATTNRVGLKPLIVGAVHGLAGSAALTLLVLTQVHSMLLGLCYLLIFGIGSIGGMTAVSCIIGLPFALNLKGFAQATLRLQAVAGAAGLGFGCWYAYSVGSLVLR